MDEASSKFVDQLVVEKMLDEKLQTVTHQPRRAPQMLLDDAFPAMASIMRLPDADRDSATGLITFHSPVACDYPENRTVWVTTHPVAEQKGVVLLVHGLFEDNRNIYNFFVGELNRQGYGVYMMTLPFHYERAPKESHFSGEYFLSADLGRTKRAFIQAVMELLHFHDWIANTEGTPPFVVGFSMGGTVCLSAAAKSNRIRGLAVVNPAADLSEVIWTSPLCATIKNDLLNAGWRRLDTSGVIATFDPFILPRPMISPERMLFIYGLYDQITRPDQYESFIAKWRFLHVRKYKAGHLNTLRVPRLSIDISTFHKQVIAAQDMRR